MKTIKNPRSLIILFLIFFNCGSTSGRLSRLTAVIGAFDDEVKLIEQRLENTKTELFLGITFKTGQLNGTSVVVAYTGVGKVNAAMTTSLILDRFHPSEVIFTGIAGGLNPELKPGDIVIADTLAQHDLGDIIGDVYVAEGARNPVTGNRNPVFIPSDSMLVSLATRAAASAPLTGANKGRPITVVGTIVTGDVFVASDVKKIELRQRFGADAVEMEGAAVAQVCYQQGVPFVVIRSLSDSANDIAPADLRKFYATAATNSAELVCRLVSVLNNVR